MRSKLLKEKIEFLQDRGLCFWCLKHGHKTYKNWLPRKAVPTSVFLDVFHMTKLDDADDQMGNGQRQYLYFVKRAHPSLKGVDNICVTYFFTSVLNKI